MLAFSCESLLSLLSYSSRQRYVLGDSAMQKMAQSSVFLSGMGGLGIEIGVPTSILLFCELSYGIVMPMIIMKTIQNH